ncbi:MAG: hypothetical protein ABFS14_10545, partial [Gemmatimonadota bacterium]
ERHDCGGADATAGAGLRPCQRPEGGRAVVNTQSLRRSWATFRSMSGDTSGPCAVWAAPTDHKDIAASVILDAADLLADSELEQR